MENNPSEPNNQVKSIRTFQSDVEAIVKSGEGSMAKIAIAENERRIKKDNVPETEDDKPKSSLKNKILIVITIILILLGAGAVVSVVFFKPKEITKVPITINQSSIINTENNKNFDVSTLTREKIIKIITDERDKSNIKPNAFTNINLTNGDSETSTKITAKELFSKLKLNVPSEVARNLESDYVLGIHNFNGNKVFLILRTNYFQNAFIGMLSWEKTMREELADVFIPPKISATEATTSDQIIKKPDVFEDIVIRNKDARALKDDDGKIILLYSFPDKNTLVITTSSDTLNQIVSRLISIKQVQ